jgi:polyhydroxyalkanoate synthesis repressor PhaR
VAPERLIKRYDNRKLYDAADRRYVTLDELARRVGAGDEVRVVDQKTGEDLTNLTLAQIVLEALRQRTALVPRALLVQLVRLSVAGFPAASWPDARGAAARARDEAERIVGGLLARGRLTLEEGLALRQDVAASVHRLVSETEEGMLGKLQTLIGAGRPARPARTGKARTPSRPKTTRTRAPRRAS